MGFPNEEHKSIFHLKESLNSNDASVPGQHYPGARCLSQLPLKQNLFPNANFSGENILVTELHCNQPPHKTGSIWLWICLEYQKAISL